MTDDKLYTSLSANTIMAKVTNHFQRTKLITSSTDKHYPLDSEDDFRSRCRNDSHQQQFFSELPPLGRSHYMVKPFSVLLAYHEGRSKRSRIWPNHSKANNVMSQSGFEFSAGKCAKAKRSRVILLLLLIGQKNHSVFVLFVKPQNTFFLTKQGAQQTNDQYHVTVNGLLHVVNRRIHADVIVYIFAHLHTALRIEGNMLDKNWLQAAKELVKLSTWWNF